MTIQATTEFNIENAISPTTGKAFGSKYAGKFAIKRPSIKDKITIAIRDAESTAMHGAIIPELVGDGAKLLSYIMSFIEVTAITPVPEWFDLDKMYDDLDEEAILSVWSEVQTFLNSFRPKTGGSDGREGNQQLEVLVQE